MTEKKTTVPWRHSIRTKVTFYHALASAFVLLFLVVSLYILQTQKFHFAFIVFFSLPLFIILLVLSFWFVARELIRPLEKLAVETREIGNRRDFLEVPVARMDEIGAFRENFNRMLVRLRETTVSRIELMKEIEERKKSEEELVKLSSVVRQSAEAVAITNRDGVIEYVNPAFEKQTGYHKEEAVGKTSRLLKSGKHPKEFYENLWNTILRGETFQATIYNKRKDGSLYYEEKIITPIRNDEGNIVHFVSTGRDVTEQIRLQQSLRKANEDLLKANEELRVTQLQLIESAKMETVGQLAVGVAHEVKNPLGVIQFAIDGLKLQFNGIQMAAEVEPLLEDMTQALKRADSVVKGLLNFSRTSELHLEGVSINDILDRTLLLMKYPMLKARVTLETNLGERLPKVKIDGNKVEQVFLNLFMNAVQAMEERRGGTLAVKTSLEKMDVSMGGVGGRAGDRFREGETALSVEICDSGPGIPEEHLKKVFDPFFTTKPVGKGTGLGLAVSRKIVDLNKGLIRITNRSEGGARVQLFFPIPTKEHSGT